MDPRTLALGSDRWLTDSRVYNLVWLGRWIERAQNVARVLLWAVREHASGNGGDLGLEEVLGMAASIRGVTVEPGGTNLDALLTRDTGASLRGCLVAARYNATHVAPIEVIQTIGAAIETVEGLPPTSTQEAEVLVSGILRILDDLHQAMEEAWFHSETLSQEEVYRRFVQQ